MSELRIQLPAKMRAFAHPKRHKVARGGRGGAKSWSIAKMLLAKGVGTPIRWLCTREIQKSLRDSVHKLLSDQVKAMGLTEFYDCQRETIRGANGTEFLFAGLQDHTADSIKSFEGCDGAWVEEAHSVSAKSAEILIPTIRKPGSEIWWSYNPDQEDDYVHQRFVVRGDPNAVVVEINWRDNPWFPEVLDIERRQLQAINDDLYQHVWEGKCRSIAGLLFKRHWFKRYDKLPENLSQYMASDYAGGPDPESDREPDHTEHGVFGLNEVGDLYATDWWYGQTDPEQWITAGVRMVKVHKPKVWFEEKGVILRATDAAITKRLREMDVWVLREPLASAGNKTDRALGFAARASAGAVWLPNNEWGDRLLNQLCSFNGQEGRPDDAVDVCSLVARGLDQMSNARPKAPVEHKPIVPFSRQHFEAAERMQQHSDAERRRYYR